jgi:hypothetical protein
MANWDFCDDCNGGKHCCYHEVCNHGETRDISSYSIKELRLEIKKRFEQQKKDKELEKQRKMKEIKNLEKKLKKLKQST